MFDDVNLITKTDSYKWSHPSMLADDTIGLQTYLECRLGGEYPETLWYGALNYYLHYLTQRVTLQHLEEAQDLDGWHFPKGQLDVKGWKRVINVHGGRLPIRIHAAPEGSVVPVGNALMTVESRDPYIPWVVGHIEGLIEKVWYPMAVATASWHLRKEFEEACALTGGGMPKLMLQDFGYRGVSSEESARIGGSAHLTVSQGSDTIEALLFARKWYGAGVDVGYSVAAAEHMVMTDKGREGEINKALHIIATHPNQIVSIVADSFDYYGFVKAMCAPHVKELIDRYRVKLVIRPDSPTKDHPNPEDLVLWTLREVASRLGTTQTSTGHHVIPWLSQMNGHYSTVQEGKGPCNLLEPVFDCGVVLRQQTWMDITDRVDAGFAKLAIARQAADKVLA